MSLSSAIQAVGLVLVAAGVAVWSRPAGAVAAGVFLFVWGLAAELARE